MTDLRSAAPPSTDAASALGAASKTGSADSVPNYAGMWMSRAAPLAYRVLPKCGCSSIGQVLHHLDHGRFYEGSIHDLSAPILKWGVGGDAEIARRFAERRIFSFTFVRNPYRRALSCFADKILGFQPEGTRYRDGAIHAALAGYGVADVAQAPPRAAFHAFLRMVVDSLEKPGAAPSDMHWTPCAAHLRYTFERALGWRLDFIGHVERLDADLGAVLAHSGVWRWRRPKAPRENAAATLDAPPEAFFGEEEIALMRRAYAEDFALFGYSEDPAVRDPVRPVDLGRVHAALGVRP